MQRAKQYSLSKRLAVHSQILDVTTGKYVLWIRNETPCYSFSVSLGALYRPLLIHMLLTVVHCAIVSTFKGTINSQPLLPGKQF